MDLVSCPCSERVSFLIHTISVSLWAPGVNHLSKDPGARFSASPESTVRTFPSPKIIAIATGSRLGTSHLGMYSVSKFSPPTRPVLAIHCNKSASSEALLKFKQYGYMPRRSSDDPKRHRLRLRPRDFNPRTDAGPNDSILDI